MDGQPQPISEFLQVDPCKDLGFATIFSELRVQFSAVMFTYDVTTQALLCDENIHSSLSPFSRRSDKKYALALWLDEFKGKLQEEAASAKHHKLEFTWSCVEAEEFRWPTLRVIMHRNQNSDNADIWYGCFTADAEKTQLRQIARAAENAPGVLYEFVMEPSGKFYFSYLHEKAIDIYGVPAHTLVNDPDAIAEFCHPDDLPGLIEAITESVETLSVFKWEGRILSAIDNVARWISASSIPEKLGDGSVHWDGMLLDVSWRKKAEKQISDNERMYQQMLDAIPDLILVKDSESKILWANRAMCDYYGMDGEEIFGIIDADHVDPSLTKAYLEDDQRVFKEKATVNRREELVTNHSGELRPFETIKAPIFDSNGHVKALIAVCRDISERKRYEKRIEDERLKSLLSARMATLGEMAGGIAHEINNPLTVMVGKAKQISRLIVRDNVQDEGSQQKTQQACMTIIETGTRISEIVRSMHIVARDSSKDPLVAQSVAGLVTDTLSLCKSRFLSAGVELTTNLKSDSSIECNPGRLGQLLLNLLNNAYDAVSDVDTKWVQIVLKPCKDAYVELHIIDSGKGIPREQLGQIMLPFFTTKEAGKGIGLGLSISKAIAEEHHGKLFVDTTSTHTCFVLKLPLKQPKRQL